MLFRQKSNALQLTNVSQLVGGVNKTTSIGYNKDGLPTTITLPTTNWLQQTIGYTANHRPHQINWSGGLGGTLGVTYGYDNLERLISRKDLSNSKERTFSYSARNELTGYTDKEYTQEWVCPTFELTDCYWDTIVTVVGNATYTYDAVGNRTDSGASLQATSNRYSTFLGYTFTYDADGNVIRKQKPGFDQQLTWNSLGQLTSVTTNGVTVNYRYNGFGERIYRAVGSTGSRYVYDGDDLALEVDLAGNKVREYTYYPGTDRPHSVLTATGEVYYFAMEYPGHVVGLVNSSGGLTNRYSYSPWGKTELVSEGTSNPLRFMGREFDSQSGLYYVRNRWYDPEIGRFISEDPIGLSGGVNVYAYAGNNPVNSTDPTGLCQKDGSPTFLETVDPMAYGIELCGRGPVPGGWSSGWYSSRGGRGTTDGFTAPPPDAAFGGGGGGGYVGQSQSAAQCVLSLFLTTGGTASGLKEAEHIRGSGASLEWRGKNGKWYPERWGGNQWTGGRNAVVAAGKAARTAGAAFAIASIGFSGVEVIGALRQGDTIGAAWAMTDVAFTFVGFLGPQGFAISLAYSGIRYAMGCM